MDDTLEDLLSAWVQALNQKHGTSVTPQEIKQWDVSAAFPSLRWEDVYAPLLQENFWPTVKPKAQAADILRRIIADGHRVYIVTASDYQVLRVKMESVLFRYFPFLSWNQVIVTSHKQMIKGDVLIDDRFHNLKGGDYEKLLMDAPHNRGYHTKRHGMTRVKNWEEVYQRICEIASQASGSTLPNK